MLPAPVLRAASAIVAAAARARGTEPALGPNALTFVDRRGSVSTARIRAELGWEPRVSLAEGLERIELWMASEGSSGPVPNATSASAGASP